MYRLVWWHVCLDAADPGELLLPVGIYVTVIAVMLCVQPQPLCKAMARAVGRWLARVLQSVTVSWQSIDSSIPLSALRIS